MAKAVADVNTEIQGGFASDDGESKKLRLLGKASDTDELCHSYRVFSHA